uniref:Uncharacterized protein n=1 Tax=Anguilla anguilla TaxID=7936 RepID=A0A0E9UKN4_ANGAN
MNQFLVPRRRSSESTIMPVFYGPKYTLRHECASVTETCYNDIILFVIRLKLSYLPCHKIFCHDKLST